ncbi:hypothetical protein M409DRAFT_28461 [Zasmidium cellare ATCC 36951]|uniref:Zn(2)-C6 fungal-type domain-containing protein n=1 Tax=Zasmidium cellare ATCC 36951 TaxID=1080233 RepID=A0A6A6C267_ZASCE|nr:uncharacterized protein M409DRAFT_28461 [Zasmidium cellare ATCC 36951]KAF2161131.1 hypothetical protein M409DRAFT_28461 [Zasmidium cellare ATCC 36951]
MARPGSIGTLKLPACERCRVRKLKCDADTHSSKCATCAKSSVACIIVDNVTKERYTRGGIYQLEQRLRELEADVAAQSTSGFTQQAGDLRHVQSPKTSVGVRRGLERLTKTAKHTIPQPSAPFDAVQPSPSRSTAYSAYDLPSWSAAQALASHYFSHAQLHHPLMPQYPFSNALQRVYGGSDASASAEDLFRVNIVFAISSVTTYRRGTTHEHPYGYFRAAVQNLSNINLTGSLSGIQNMLLIARFARYYHIDCSIWDMSRTCMRQCIALKLHRPPRKSLAPIDEQVLRNVFWECYLHDRYSSGILGRPYAIAEEDITVQLPVEVSETDLISAHVSSLDDPSLQYFTNPNEVSVFRFIVGLRRVIAKITNHFHRAHTSSSRPGRTLADAQRVRADFDHLLNQLMQARSKAPIFDNPTSLYQRSEWYDFLFEKERLTLIRGALNQIPLDGFHPPQELLRSCLGCGINVIELYMALFSHGHITWMRSYFQILFTSGLSIMYSASFLSQNRASVQHDQSDLDVRAARALASASELMKMFVIEMPDAARFAMVFEGLMKQYMGTGTRAVPTRATTPSGHEPTAESNKPADVAFESNAMQLGPQAVPEHQDVPSTYLGADLLSIHHPADAPSELHLQAPQHSQVHHDNSFLTQGPFDESQLWTLFSSAPDSILGQVEAGLGEYAWGIPPDNNLFDQWDDFRAST